MYISQDDFKSIYCGPVKELLKEIDYTIFNSDNVYSLLYLFPLIERLIIETLGLSFDMKVEIDEQGKIRTINSVLETEECKKIFDANALDALLYYFDSQGLRNKIMHFDPMITSVECKNSDIFRIQQIALYLMVTYNEEYQKYNFEQTPDIEPISFEQEIESGI